MNNLDFVKLACSNDETRGNLTHVFRDTNCFVATDGHRIHYVNGQPQIEKGFFVDGYDGTFCDWQQAIPSESPSYECSLYFNDSLIKKLKGLLAYMKAFNGNGKFTQHCVSISISGKVMTLTTNGITNGQASIDLFMGDTEGIGKFETLGIDLRYLIDAIAPSNDKLGAGVTFKFHGTHRPIIIENLLGKAVIMPMRIA
jgi:DNA polymerase III sliding clamp (beta) subunit (PCNA family)